MTFSYNEMIQGAANETKPRPFGAVFVPPVAALAADVFDWKRKSVDEYDFKPELKAIVGSDDDSYWVNVGPGDVDHDLIGNMAYGYIGGAAGWSQEELLWGAHGAPRDIGPVWFVSTTGLAAKVGPVTIHLAPGANPERNTAQDDGALMVGRQLWDAYGPDLTFDQFYGAVQAFQRRTRALEERFGGEPQTR